MKLRIHVVIFWLMVIAILGGWCFVLMIPSRKPANTKTAPAASPIPPVAHLLQSGNGHDWLKLSQREKVRLAVLIQDNTKRHEPYDYVEFLGAFYKPDAGEIILSRQISEMAAICAAMEIQN